MIMYTVSLYTDLYTVITVNNVSKRRLLWIISIIFRMIYSFEIGMCEMEMIGNIKYKRKKL